jgi:hypothetical protein
VQFGAITSQTTTLTITAIGTGSISAGASLVWTNDYTPKLLRIQAGAALTTLTINFVLTGDTAHLIQPASLVFTRISQFNNLDVMRRLQRP